MLQATQQASQRTKNRLREHDLMQAHTILKDTPRHMRGQTVYVCKHCDWFGWLPNNELRVQE